MQANSTGRAIAGRPSTHFPQSYPAFRVGCALAALPTGRRRDEMSLGTTTPCAANAGRRLIPNVAQRPSQATRGLNRNPELEG